MLSLWTTVRSSTWRRSTSSFLSWMGLQVFSGELPSKKAQSLSHRICHVHSCKPKWVVADMAFFTPSWMIFWKTHGVKTMPTGRATPWPNRAETAVRLFKRQYEKLLMDASTHPTLNKVMLRDLIRECCWARNTTLTISGYTPVELATGRRPTDFLPL